MRKSKEQQERSAKFPLPGYQESRCLLEESELLNQTQI